MSTAVLRAGNRQGAILTVLVALWLAAAALSLPARAADDLQIRQWIDEAHSWERKGRDDLAIDLWNKLLVLDPNYGEALVSLGLLEARAGHQPRARELLGRAQRLQPQPGGLSRLGAALGTSLPEPRAETADASPVELPQRQLAETKTRAPRTSKSRTTTARKTDATSRELTATSTPEQAAPVAVAPPGPAASDTGVAPVQVPAPVVASPVRSAGRPTSVAVRGPQPATPVAEMGAPLRAPLRATAPQTPIPLPADLFGVQGFQPDVLPEPGTTPREVRSKPRPCTPFAPDRVSRLPTPGPASVQGLTSSANAACAMRPGRESTG